MPQTPSEMIQKLLKNPTNLDVVSELVAIDATYVSLNYENAELKKIMPWAGTAKGPQAIVDTYTQVGQYWETPGFQDSRYRRISGARGRVRQLHI